MTITTINAILMDNRYNGLIEYSSTIWNGAVYLIPRKELESGNYDNIVQLKNSGVYFLFGVNSTTNRGMMYIGQSSDVLSRLKSSDHRHKHFWIEAITFVGPHSMPLGATELYWLERHFFDIAMTVKNYEVKNTSTPSGTKVPVTMISYLNTLAENMKTILGFTRHNFFDKIIPYTHKIKYSIDELKQIAEENKVDYTLCNDDRINRMWIIMALKKAGIKF